MKLSIQARRDLRTEIKCIQSYLAAGLITEKAASHWLRAARRKAEHDRREEGIEGLSQEGENTHDIELTLDWLFTTTLPPRVASLIYKFSWEHSLTEELETEAKILKLEYPGLIQELLSGDYTLADWARFS